jgi:type IV pilus assembly protein PilA
MEMIMKRALAKKNGKKGFTLVEVIVVLVILAILAAIAIPALTGYIDKANKRAIITEGRTIAVALQAAASDTYGSTNTDVDEDSPYDDATENIPGSDLTQTWGEAVDELTGASYDPEDITDITFAGNKLTGFTYTKGTRSVTLDAAGKYTAS